MQSVDEPVVVPLKVALLPLEIENGGKIEPPVQLAVSRVIVEPNEFCTVNWAVTVAADAAPVLPIANRPATITPAQVFDTDLNTLIVLGSPLKYRPPYAACLIKLPFANFLARACIDLVAGRETSQMLTTCSIPGYGAEPHRLIGSSDDTWRLEPHLKFDGCGWTQSVGIPCSRAH